jgi:hypothetical protein
VATQAQKSTALLATAAVASAGGFAAWSALRERQRQLPTGTPADVRVTATPSAQVVGNASAPALAGTVTAHVHWMPLSSEDPVTQSQTYAFYDAPPPGVTTDEELEARLRAFGWLNVRIDAMPGEILPAWLPIPHGADVRGMFAARATWGLNLPPTGRPAMLVAYRPGTPVSVTQSQTATSLVHGSGASVAVYTVTDGAWWWGSFAGVGAENRSLHPQAVGYTSAECIMKLQPLLAHCVTSTSDLPPIVQ